MLVADAHENADKLEAEAPVQGDGAMQILVADDRHDEPESRASHSSSKAARSARPTPCPCAEGAT